MEAPVEIRVYRGRRSQSLFSKWLASKKDKRTVAIIQARLNRIRLGNFGDSKPVGDGVEELRIDFGPGYQTQSRDIETAKALWRDYLDDKD